MVWFGKAFLGLFLVAPWSDILAGTITGHVAAIAPDKSGGQAGGAYASKKFKFLEKIEYEELRDFVVSIERVSEPLPPGPTKHQTITQKDGEFVPQVLAVQAGSEVEFLNLDDIYHNVFSMSDACEFDLGLYKRGDGKRTVTFGLPGRVDVFCSIHTRMSCVVLVLPNPWFAVTKSDGTYTIPQVPPGTYRLRAWHARIPSLVKEVVVPPDGEVNVDFVLGTKDPRT